MDTNAPRLADRFRWSAIPAFCLLLGLTGLASAQSVSPPAAAGVRGDRPRVVPPPAAVAAADQDEALELSPFVVKAESGWNVTETLAGTRLKTDLKDVPNQLEMFTKEFMQDLALNNVDDIVMYSLNADSLDEYMQDNNAENGAMNMTKKTRVRGLAEATFSRGFFGSNFLGDSYNTDTTTVASGANPILFGLGNSAGIIDSSAGRAAMQNRGGVRLQSSSERSKRATLNLNRILIPNTLALRVDGLWSEQQTFREPNYDKQKRYTIGLLFRPTRSTTIHASYEDVDRSGNVAPRNLAMDRVSLWELAPTVPGSPYRNARPGYDNRANVPATIGNTTRIFGTHSNNNAVLVSGGSAVPAMNWGRSVTVLNPTAPTAFGVPNADFDSAANLERTFLDDTFFPYDANIVSNLRKTMQYGDIKTVLVEQRLRPNLFLELAFNREDFVQDKPMNLSQVKVFVDPNLYLPATLPGETTPRANPNFGRQYLEFTPDGHWEREVNENYRATLSYDVNPAQELKFPGARWLGRHRLSGMFERAETHEARLSGGLRPRILDDPLIPGLTLTPRTTANWAINATRSPLIRGYFSYPGDEVYSPIAAGRSWTYLDASGAPATVTYGLDSGLKSAASGKRLATSNAATDTTARKVDSVIFAWQGSFLPDREGRHRVILTYGQRRDSVRTANSDEASRTRDFSGLFPAPDQITWEPYGDATRAENRSRGIVVHPWRWASVFYNRSTTFAPVGRETYDPYGNPYPGSGGEGRDYGVQLDFWQNRVSVRYNKFESAAGPTNAPTGRLRNIIGNARTIENRVIELDPALPRINITDETRKGFPGNAPTYMVMTYREASGHELSLNVRPVPNWNIRVNATKAEAIDSDIGLEWLAWVQERLPVWQSVVAKNGEVDSAGRPVTWATALSESGPNETLKQFYENTVVGDTVAFMTASEGKKTDGARGKRANVITSYRFTEGRFKGFTVTGALRWRPPPTIGYPVKTLPSGARALEVDNPWRGDREVWTDLGVAYRGRIDAYGGLRYTAQLNVRNVFDEGPTIPFRAYTDGSVASRATLEPRLFIFTWGLEF